jgi:hypothetical protein
LRFAHHEQHVIELRKRRSRHVQATSAPLSRSITAPVSARACIANR